MTAQEISRFHIDLQAKFRPERLYSESDLIVRGISWETQRDAVRAGTLAFDDDDGYVGADVQAWIRAGGADHLASTAADKMKGQRMTSTMERRNERAELIRKVRAEYLKAKADEAAGKGKVLCTMSTWINGELIEAGLDSLVDAECRAHGIKIE